MLYGIGGNLSGGKTVYGVSICYKKGIKGKKVISNIHMNLDPYNIKFEFMPNYEFIDFIKKYYMSQEKLMEKFYNSVFLIDEIVNIISARSSTSGLNELITNWMMMVGKLDCDIVFTFQVKESQVDKRLREISQVYANCFRCTREGQIILSAPRLINQDILIYVIEEYDFGIRGKKYKSFTFNPKFYYPMYNTREMTLLDRSQYLRGGSKDLRRSVL